jgi:predicted Zn-dependent protease
MLSEDPNKPQAQGFESYLAAALRKKDVPLLIVADATQADFTIEGTADQKGAGWAKKIILADFRKSTSASMTVTNLRTGVVAYADSSDRSSANRGLRSSAEKLAKYLKKKIEDDEKKH